MNVDLVSPIAAAKKIVVLNLIPNTMGDSLYLIALTRVLRKNVSNAHIAVTVAPLTGELLKNEPSINALKVFPVLREIGKPHSRFRKARMYLTLMREIRAYLRTERFDACIVTLPLFAPMHLLPFLARIPLRVGFTFKGSIFSSLLTHKTRARGAVYSGEKERHFREVYLDLCRLLGLQFTQEDTKIRYDPLPEDVAEAKKLLAKLPAKKFIAFQAGAKWPEKRWPEERFVALGKLIVEKYRMHILLTGSKDEIDSNERIRKELGTHATNLCELSLGMVAAVIQQSELLVGNTSGILHLASAIGTPTIGLHWVAVPSESEPMGRGPAISVAGKGFCGDPVCANANPVFNNGCRHSIPVERVWEAVQRALEK